MILTIVILTAVCALLACAVARNRCANLEYLLDMERDIACELSAQLAKAYAAMEEHELLRQLDDATRNAAYWQERTDTLVKENNTLAVDLWHTERECQYLRGFVRRQKDTTAGVVLLYGTPNPKRQLHVATAEAMP